MELKNAGKEDAGIEDAGMKDAGMKDPGMEDAGMKDPGMEDAGMKDAGMEGFEEAQVPVENQDADATEADVSEVDLDQEEQEKQPMTGGEAGAVGGGEDAPAEKNGSVKLKILEEDEEQVKFSGLTKEELLRVAGSRGWVRTRWTLLVLFWLGWLGMLVSAVIIILQAPGCPGRSKTDWGDNGLLYQIGKVQVFSASHNLKGLQQKIDSLHELKVKGLVIGPIHVAPPDDAVNLSFEEISSEAGTLDQFKGLVQAAHQRGISIILDLTPNYRGLSGPWFSNTTTMVTSAAEKLKPALMFWIKEGVDGVQLSGVEQVAGTVPSLWSDIRAIVQNRTEEHPKKRVLIGVTDRSSAENVSSLLSSTGVDLLISRVLRPGGAHAATLASAIQHLYSSHNQTKLAWSLGGPADGHLASAVGPALVKLHQLLLLTLPGTPVINYGDEIGLTDKDNKFPKMLWDSDKEPNGTLQDEPCLSCRGFLRRLTELREKERSLLFGDFVLLFNSSSSAAYLRVWDQSERFLAIFNWAAEAVTLELGHAALPRQAVVVVSTNSSSLAAGKRVDLKTLTIGPEQAALLKFPYVG